MCRDRVECEKGDIDEKEYKVESESADEFVFFFFKQKTEYEILA